MELMREPITLRLGGRAFAVRPLILEQVEAIEAALADAPRPAAAGRRIILAALSRDHADAGDIECSVGEVAAATAAVLRLGGFLPEVSGAPAGEAGAPPTASAPVGGATSAAG